MKEKLLFPQSKTRLYHIWHGMKNRCLNPNDKNYKSYGGRGITICSEWIHDFCAFEDWAYSNGYREYLSIDRIDNDKGYSPDNCRWVTQKVQARNTRQVIYATINGTTQPLIVWARQYGIEPATIRYRYHQGDRGERLIRPSERKTLDA